MQLKKITSLLNCKYIVIYSSSSIYFYNPTPFIKYWQNVVTSIMSLTNKMAAVVFVFFIIYSIFLSKKLQPFTLNIKIFGAVVKLAHQSIVFCSLCFSICKSCCYSSTIMNYSSLFLHDFDIDIDFDIWFWWQFLFFLLILLSALQPGFLSRAKYAANTSYKQFFIYLM